MLCCVLIEAMRKEKGRKDVGVREPHHQVFCEVRPKASSTSSHIPSVRSGLVFVMDILIQQIVRNETPFCSGPE